MMHVLIVVFAIKVITNVSIASRGRFVNPPRLTYFHGSVFSSMVPADDIHGTHITATKKFLDEFQAVHILAHARLRREFYRGEAIGPRMWGYVTPSLQPMTMVFIGRVLDKASGTNYGILPPPDWVRCLEKYETTISSCASRLKQSTFGLEELPRGRIILGNPGRGNTILDAFYTKQMEHLKEMMELEAADMGLTMVGVNSER